MVGTVESSQCSNSQSYSLRPGWRIVGALSMVGCQVIVRKALPWIIVGNMFGDAACTSG